MKTEARRGFTLIELLTVVAIIAILAGITLAALGPAREAAKLRKLDGTFHQLEVAFTSYYAQSYSFPPGYGFLTPAARDAADPYTLSPNVRYFLRPYLSYAGHYGEQELYDLFSTGLSYDTNRDNVIDPTEFMPIGSTFANSNYVGFPEVLCPPHPRDAPVLHDDLDAQLSTDPRPLYYAPVNLEQYRKAKAYWLAMYEQEQSQGDLEATSWPQSLANLSTAAELKLRGITFPPPSYDAYVLISIGPAIEYHGVVAAGAEYQEYRDTLFSNYDLAAYHILALRAYHLGSRDLNENGQGDFNYEARKAGEAAGSYNVNLRQRNETTGSVETYTITVNNQLPTRRAPDGYGPVIFVVN